jgi:hypothetical protein
VDQKGLGDLAKGDPAQALVRLSQAGHRPRDGRSLLVSRAAEARLWNSLGHRAKAVGLADFLVAQVEDRGLADWEPDLAVLALKAAFDAYHSAGPASAAKARGAAVLLALASPAEALALPPTDPEG